MSEIIIFIIIGIAGGLIGGMGMGGGTLLIPLLTIFASLDQHAAQAVNLLAFIPMSVIALIVHIKNKLVDFKSVLPVSIPAAAASVGGAFVSKVIDGKELGAFFGWFLIALGIYQLVTLISAVKKKKAENKKIITQRRFFK